MKYNLKKLYSTAVEFDDGSMAVFVSRWDDETETMTMVARNYLSDRSDPFPSPGGS